MTRRSFLRFFGAPAVLAIAQTKGWMARSGTRQVIGMDFGEPPWVYLSPLDGLTEERARIESAFLDALADLHKFPETWRDKK